MALKAGRVGVAKDQVDEFGKIIGGATPANVYTKTQCDNKFETKAHIGGLQFRDNSGTAQYKLPNGDWVNFSSGGGGIGFNIPEDLLQTDARTNNETVIDSGGYAVVDGVLYVDFVFHNTNSQAGMGMISITLDEIVTNPDTYALYTPANNSYNAGYAIKKDTEHTVLIGIYNGGLPANVSRRVYGEFKLSAS